MVLCKSCGKNWVDVPSLRSINETGMCRECNPAQKDYSHNGTT